MGFEVARENQGWIDMELTRARERGGGTLVDLIQRKERHLRLPGDFRDV